MFSKQTYPKIKIKKKKLFSTFQINIYIYIYLKTHRFLLFIFKFSVCLIPNLTYIRRQKKKKPHRHRTCKTHVMRLLLHNDKQQNLCKVSLFQLDLQTTKFSSVTDGYNGL